MKASVQIYGMIIVFTALVVIIPELLNLSVYFTHLADLSSYVVEVIEVNEGINDNVIGKIEQLQEANPGFEISYSSEEINDRYRIYRVVVRTDVKLNILKMDYNLKSERESKRVLY